MENYEELKKHVNILLVDDDLDYIQVTAFFLKTKRYNRDIATSGCDALNKVSNGNLNIILLLQTMKKAAQQIKLGNSIIKEFL